ncbi:MAG: carboxypeptidase regulatory-like domain-containing protein [Vicinamibacteria bacterium]|nr:carboxypeptidase regulatory-like domain-containing protein [Vicinamibacteria bacterium]
MTLNNASRRWWVLGLALLLLITPALHAQETAGTIAGVVKSPDGAVLPGATVEASGPAGLLSVVSDAKGEYRFPRLPSGRYKIVASLAGFSRAEASIDVAVGTTARAEFTLQLSSVTETINVIGEAAAVDITSSATATSISRERIDLIPRGRDFTDVVAQAAGASDESQAGGISIDGSSGSENRFVIDGIDTTSPQTGVNSVPMRADFIEEVQVKSAGYAAEFGGSTGGVVNAITKSGNNQFHGGVLTQYQDRSWGGPVRGLLRRDLATDAPIYINPEKDEQTRWDPGFFLGGPILKDKLFFFGSYQPGITKTERTVTFTNGVTNTFPQDTTVDYWAANISGNISSKLLFRFGANFSPYETERSLPGQDGRTTQTSLDNYTRGTKGDRRTFSGSLDWFPTSTFVVSARGGRYLTDAESTGVNFPGLIHNINSTSTAAGIAALPAEFRRVAGFTSDTLITDAQAKDEYKRDFLGIDATYFFSGGGDHQIKFGAQIEKIYNDVQKGYNADRIIYYAGRPYLTSTGQSVQGTYGYFRLLNISTFGAVESRNDAFFIQDTWKVSPRLTLNLGVRSEHERVPNFGSEGVETPIEFGLGEKLAPRVGFAYDITGDQKWKAYGSWGLYYDVMKYEMPRGSFGGDKWVDYFYLWNNPNWQSNTCGTGTNTIAERPSCAAGTFIEALDRRFNSATDLDSTVDPDLKPMKQMEIQFGVTHELGNSMVVGARFVRKNLLRTIEDVGILVSGIGEVFYIANPGEGISLELADAPGIPNFPKAKREYTAIELSFDKRFANNWALFANYTLSKLYGNYSGLASSDEDGRTSPNVNRFFDHIENTFDRNGDLVFGKLGTDRPHNLKVQAIYRAPWDMTFSVNQLVASGIPQSEEAFVGANVPFFPFGRGNLDRTDMLVNTDLSIYQDFKFGKASLQLGVTILNLFDRDAVTRRINDRTVGSLPLTTSQFFAGGWDYNSLISPSISNTLFNRPDQFQSPREVRLSAKLSF